MRVMKQWEKFVQRCGRCPIPENIEGQTGRGSDEDVPAQCRGVGLETFKTLVPKKIPQTLVLLCIEFSF